MKYEDKLSLLFISVGVAFVVLTIPDVILQGVDIVLPETEVWMEVFAVVHSVTQTVFMLNFCINPIIYFTMNSYFRNRVRDILGLNKQKPTVAN